MQLLITGTRRGRTDFDEQMEAFVARHGMPTLMILGCNKRTQEQLKKGKLPPVDEQAMLWAVKHNVPYKIFYADWSLGSIAGPLRNTHMVEDCEPGDRALGFPDKDSRGTWDCIRKCKAADLIVEVV